jgi:hypothetical protein
MTTSSIRQRQGSMAAKFGACQPDRLVDQAANNLSEAEAADCQLVPSLLS